MQKVKKYISMALLLLLAVLVLVFPYFSGVSFAHALTIEAEGYTDALSDLKKDKTFSENLYPLKRNDYSLQVLGIAESSSKELFVYVYQPSGDVRNLRATTINISRGYKMLKFINYKLTLLNSNKTFYKYKVENFLVSDDDLRYYDITTIYRAWNADYDDDTGNDNTISEVPFNVSRIYKFENKDGELDISDAPTETIEVDKKYVGFVRYFDGFKLCTTACDSHFVAFSTKMPIDEIAEADIYFAYQTMHCEYKGNFHFDTFSSGKSDWYSYVTSEQQVKHTTDGLFNVGTITRDRVVKVDDFVASENINQFYFKGTCAEYQIESTLTEEFVKNLKGCEWVVRFFETPYSSSYTGPLKETDYWAISDVSILRLEGISDGKPFNMGVIDNKQTGSQKPVNDWKEGFTILGGNADDFWRIVKIVLAVLVGILVVVVVCWGIRVIVEPFKAIDKTVKAVKKKNKRR